MFFKLAFKSLVSRKASVILILLSISISIYVLLGVEHIRQQAKQSFTNSVSGVDLIVGARTGNLNLLLYSVFHVGSPTNNVRWQTYEKLSKHKKVDWSVPLSLGDSHRGYRVVGTTPDFFTHFSFGSKQKLEFIDGKSFENVFGVVLGHDVAKTLGYKIDDQIIVAHGLGQTSFKQHDENPFTVVGVLRRTGTPIDQTVYVSLQGIEAIHQPGKHNNKPLDQSSFQPEQITAVLLGLNSKMATFQVQRYINNYKQEPLTSILPGVTLVELWQMIGLLENVLRLVSVFVLIASLLGLSSMLLISIREREPEVKLLRMVGAPPWYLFMLIQLEAMMIALLSIAISLFALWLSIFFANNYLASEFGLFVSPNFLNPEAFKNLTAVLVLSLICALLPAISMYRTAR